MIIKINKPNLRISEDYFPFIYKELPYARYSLSTRVKEQLRNLSLQFLYITAKLPNLPYPCISITSKHENLPKNVSIIFKLPFTCLGDCDYLIIFNLHEH